MVYTEVKERNGNKYYYRVISVRKDKKVSKKRKYLGVNLDNSLLEKKEKEADEELLADKRKKINRQINEIKAKIIPILKKNKIKKAGIFGSYVRGEQKKNSDVDIIIEPPQRRKFSLLDLVALQMALEKKLGIKVDLLTYNGIYHLLKDIILKEEVRIT